MRIRAVTRPDQKPNCAAPEALAVVDAAFERPGGPAGIEMRERVCPGCPVGEQCLAWAMSQWAPGIWGGTSPMQRTQHGAPSRAPRSESEAR